MNKYDIKILSGIDSIRISEENPSTLLFDIEKQKESLPIEKIDAVVIKTMDTGPIVEDMYVEIYVDNMIYIILSEMQNFKNIIFDVLNKTISLDLAKFIEASTYHFCKTFILFERNPGSISFEDTEEKKINLLEKVIEKFSLTGKKDTALCGFILAIMSYCPLYMIFGKGEHAEQVVSLTALEGCPIPLFTSIQKCPDLPDVEIKKIYPRQYVGAMLAQKTFAVVNFGNENYFVLSSNLIQEVLASLVSFHEDESSPKQAEDKKDSFLKSIFGKGKNRSEKK